LEPHRPAVQSAAKGPVHEKMKKKTKKETSDFETKQRGKNPKEKTGRSKTDKVSPVRRLESSNFPPPAEGRGKKGVQQDLFREKECWLCWNTGTWGKLKTRKIISARQSRPPPEELRGFHSHFHSHHNSPSLV